MAIGVASVLNSFALLREHVEQTEGEYRALLDKLQNGHAPVGADAPKRGRPPKASKAILDAVAAAAALEAPAEVAPAVKKVRKKSEKDSARAGWAAFDTPEKRQAEMVRRLALRKGKKKKQAQAPAEGSGPTWAVADLAKEIGYADTWGLSVWLRDHGVPVHSEKRPDKYGRLRSVKVLTQKNYERMLKLREKLGMKALNKLDEKAPELEAATAA